MKIRVLKEMVSKVVIVDGSRVLLLRRTDKYITERNHWAWDLPGGHLDSGETTEEAARREVLEETALEIGPLSYVGKDSNAGKLTYFYRAEGKSTGHIELSGEHNGHKWVGKKDLKQYRERVGDMYYKMIMRVL
jgi:8-oxo-dGTP pyrophosphatase MutT (NUDIX family)